MKQNNKDLEFWNPFGVSYRSDCQGKFQQLNPMLIVTDAVRFNARERGQTATLRTMDDDSSPNSGSSDLVTPSFRPSPARRHQHWHLHLTFTARHRRKAIRLSLSSLNEARRTVVIFSQKYHGLGRE